MLLSCYASRLFSDRLLGVGIRWRSLSWVEMVSWLHSSLNNDFPISLSISRGTVFCREHYIRDRHGTLESVQWLIFDVVKKYILGPILGKVPTSSIVLPFLQIISCFSFSRYIELAIRLHIYFVQIHGKKYTYKMIKRLII